MFAKLEAFPESGAAIAGYRRTRRAVLRRGLEAQDVGTGSRPAAAAASEPILSLL